MDDRLPAANVKRLGLWSFAVLLSASLRAGSAGAQPVASASNEIARSHYENGSRYYAIQRFAEASREFEAAYEITHRSELLFNIGRAHEDAALAETDPERRREHTRQGLDAYQRFLTAGAPGVDRTALQARMSELRARLTAQSRVETASPVGPLVPPAQDSPSRRGYALPIALFSVGAAVFGASVYTGLSARSIHVDLAAQCPGGVCNPSLEASANRGRTLATATDVLLGVGAAAVVAGVVTLFLPSRREPPATASVWCVRDGCLATAGMRF